MQFFASLSRSRYHAALACLFLTLAIILGGGNIDNPSTELALELLAALCAIAWIWMPGSLRLPVDWKVWLVAGLILLVPLLQLIPLPPSIWTTLPGRERELAALNLVAKADSWRPLTVSPHRTLTSLLGLFPPVLMLLMAGALSRRARSWLFAALVITGLATALLGAAQLGDKAGLFHLYDYSHRMVVIGFQNNRNHTADLLLVALLALATLGNSSMFFSKDKNQSAWMLNVWVLALAFVFVLAVILTRSRTGIALAFPALLAFGAIFSWNQPREWNRPIAAFVGGCIVMAVAGLFLLPTNGALQGVAARFDLAPDGRATMWRNTLEAIQEYIPVGSGLGTFRSAYNALEPLLDMDAKQAGYAHNDFLQLMLEAGVIGYLALAMVLGLVLRMAFRSWHDDEKRRAQVMFGLFSLLVIAAHSQVDYPLRTISMACVAAVAIAMLASPPEQQGGVFQGGMPYGRRSPSSLMVKSTLTVLPLAFGVAALGSGLDRLSAHSPDLEQYVLAPFRAQADTQAALAAVSQMDSASGLRHAERAVRADPASQKAIASLALARASAGDAAGAQSAFQVAALGGWHEPIVLLYWHGIAQSEGNLPQAAAWADAALRAFPAISDPEKLFGPLEATAQGRKALAERLILEPDWADRYFALKPIGPDGLQNRLLTARQVAKLGHRLGCRTPLPLVGRLLGEGKRALAASLWADHCDGSGLSSGLVDDNFAELARDQRYLPFGWRLHAGADISISFAESYTGEPILRLSNTSLVTRNVLSQPAVFEPGDYRVRVESAGRGALAAGRLKVSYDCTNRQPVLGPGDGDVARDGQILRVTECPAPTFRLWLSPGQEALSISGIEVEKL